MKTITWVGLLAISDKKVLMVRESDKDFFVLPGGRMEEGESQLETLERELSEEINVRYKNIKKYGEYLLPGRAEGVEINFIVYIGELNGNYEPGDEISEIKWIDSSYEEKGIKIGVITEKVLFPELKEKKLIN